MADLLEVVLTLELKCGRVSVVAANYEKHRKDKNQCDDNEQLG